MSNYDYICYTDTGSVLHVSAYTSNKTNKQKETQLKISQTCKVLNCIFKITATRSFLFMPKSFITNTKKGAAA